MKKYIYPEQESKSLEFKSRPPAKLLALIKTCVAFANGVGGKIIIGVDDKTKEILGVDDKIRDRIYNEFPNSLFDATSPALSAEIYEKRFGDKSVMIIEIPFSFRKPAYVKREGIPDGVYLRAGPNTRRADEEYVEELKRENNRMVYDEEIVNADVSILPAEKLKSIYGAYNTKMLLSEKVIGRTPASKQMRPTIAGILMFSDSPHNYIPEAVIQCTRFQGIDGRNIIQTEEIQGNLVKQAETSLGIVKSWMTREYTLFGTRLLGKVIIPEVALREAIINALIHRKYWIAGAIKIALYDNRLEIFNPGNFPGLVDLSRLGDGTTYLRNPNLARIARRFGLVEKLGTGIREIMESCNKARIMRPEYKEGPDSVKVIFHFLPAENISIADYDQILSLFNVRGEIKVNDVEVLLGVSRNTATRKLNHLMESGKIIRHGKGPAVKYILVKKIGF